MSDVRPLWALVPIKGFQRAKSRLAPVLSPAERSTLARRLCEHVLTTLRGCPGIDGVLVLSDSEEVLALAARCGAVGELDPRPAAPRLGAVVDEGLARLERRGARAVLVMMADLPLVRREDLPPLLALLRDHDRVIAPDLSRRNTNALLLRLEGRSATAFGSGDSFRQHLEMARIAGLRVAVHDAPGLAFDVDVPRDYADYAEITAPPPGRGGAGSGSAGPA